MLNRRDQRTASTTMLTLLVLPTFYVLAVRAVFAAQSIWARSAARAPLPEEHMTP